jgi:hypothetical protein
VRSSFWVGKAVAKALGLDTDVPSDKAKITGLLKVWLDARSLKVVEGYDKQRRPREFVQVSFAPVPRTGADWSKHWSSALAPVLQLLTPKGVS